MRNLPVLATLICVASLSAQAVTIPAFFATTEGGSTGNIWHPGGAMRYQQIYDSGNFTSQGITGPFTIGVLQWRADGGAVGNASTFPNVEIRMSSCTTDYLTPSTTFATNRGVDDTVVHLGPVNMVPVGGSTPNDFFVTINLTTTFTYDPTLGNDLIIEVVGGGVPTAAPAIGADSAWSYTIHGCRSLRSVTSTTATTGTLSSFTGVMRLGSPGAVFSGASNYGAGCGDSANQSIYETFTQNNFDLANTSILMSPNWTGYDVTAGSNTFVTPTTPDLGLGDDQVSGPLTLPGPFCYPTGTTTAVYMSSNGLLYLQPDTSSGCCNGDVITLLAGTARIAPFWCDLNPASTATAGTTHFEVVGNRAYITWMNVVQYGQTVGNTFQICLEANGNVEITYQAMGNPATNTVMAGWSPGNGAPDPGPRDLSAALPFTTSADVYALSLAADANPVLGTTINLVTSAIPGAAIFSATVLSFQQLSPGVGIPGADPCEQYVVGPGAAFLLSGSPTASVPFAIPSGVSWLGAQVSAQSASLVIGINPLGAITSNGTMLVFGNV